MSGTWIEQDENGRDVKVVTSQPERGVQLAGEGQEVTPDIKARIEQAKRDLSGSARGGSNPADASGAVITSDSVKGKK